MFDQLLNNAGNRSIIDFTDPQSNELKQYCKTENIMLSSLMSAGISKSIIKLKLQLAACHLLKCINNGIRIIIERLTADIEQSRKVRRQIS